MGTFRGLVEDFSEDFRMKCGGEGEWGMRVHGEILHAHQGDGKVFRTQYIGINVSV